MKEKTFDLIEDLFKKVCIANPKINTVNQNQVDMYLALHELKGYAEGQTGKKIESVFTKEIPF